MGAIISIGAMVVIVQARWQPMAQGGTYQVNVAVAVADSLPAATAPPAAAHVIPWLDPFAPPTLWFGASQTYTCGSRGTVPVPKWCHPCAS